MSMSTIIANHNNVITVILSFRFVMGIKTALVVKTRFQRGLVSHNHHQDNDVNIIISETWTIIIVMKPDATAVEAVK